MNDEELLAWLNDNPDEAAVLLPEVRRYLRWKAAPFRLLPGPSVGGRPRTGRGPFITRNGREIP